jgi:hypothetical protein
MYLNQKRKQFISQFRQECLDACPDTIQNYLCAFIIVLEIPVMPLEDAIACGSIERPVQQILVLDLVSDSFENHNVVALRQEPWSAASLRVIAIEHTARTNQQHIWKCEEEQFAFGKLQSYVTEWKGLDPSEVNSVSARRVIIEMHLLAYRQVISGSVRQTLAPQTQKTNHNMHERKGNRTIHSAEFTLEPNLSGLSQKRRHGLDINAGTLVTENLKEFKNSNKVRLR